jgi:hypothetical protein
MNKIKLLALIVFPLLLANCDEKDLPGPLDLLAGTWEASSIVTTGCDDTSQNGTLECDPFCLSITIKSDGTYTLIDGLEDPVSTESGVISATVDKLTICATGEDCSSDPPASYSLNGSSLVVTFTDQDLPGCQLKATFSKQ